MRYRYNEFTPGSELDRGQDVTDLVESGVLVPLPDSTKLERKLQDRLNRFTKLTPGTHRIWGLHRIAMELDGEADRLEQEKVPHSDPAGLRKDALYLRRLEYDLVELRIAVRGPIQSHGSGRYDDAQWPRGPRP